MRKLGLLALILVGCGPAQAVIDDAPVGDTGTDTGDTGDTGNPDDTGNPGDTGNTEVEPDLSTWQGTRSFYFADVYGQGPCEQDVHEEGVNVTDDPDYADALDACPDCEHLFEISVSPDRMCEDQTGGQGFPIAETIVRGLEFIGESDVRIYVLRGGWQGWQADTLADGTLSGVVVSYSYESEAYGAEFTATGVVDF